MKRDVIKYPIGQQDFQYIRENGYLYVDKTRYIEKIINSSKYYFLGRPRRFGKSLFLSTLKCFFEGKRDLFKGLYTDTIDYNWEEIPVFHLDLNSLQFREEGDLERVLADFLSLYENRYGIVSTQENLSLRFGNLIRAVAEKTERNVVVLIDEYDKPLVNNIHNRTLFDRNRDILAAFYSHFKSQDAYLRLVFLTGVSRFGRLSVFSSLNNIRDISLLPEFSGICGITGEELLYNFKEGTEELARVHNRTVDEERIELKKWYDGYHFSTDCLDVYNPFSILNIMANRKYSSYWVQSGTPTLLARLLREKKTNLERLFQTRCSENSLAGLDIDNLNIEALLYQTGYLTITGYDQRRKIYHLALPNEEVKQGFLEFLLPWYADLHNEDAKIFVFDFIDEMEGGKIDCFMNRLNSMFARFGYEMKFDEELNVQNIIVTLFHLIGMETSAEVHTSDGRIDILVKTSGYIYIMELKYDHTAEEALEQIKKKEYSLPWATDHRKVIGIGINFSSGKRRIDKWIAEEL